MYLKNANLELLFFSHKKKNNEQKMPSVHVSIVLTVMHDNYKQSQELHSIWLRGRVIPSQKISNVFLVL